MPVKIARKVTYDVDVKCPALGIDKQVTVDEDGLRKVYNEIDQLCDALAGALGDVRLPAYKTPQHREHTTPQGDNAAKLLNYAKAVADFTIKGACEALGLGYQVVYENAVAFGRQNVVLLGCLLSWFLRLVVLYEDFRQDGVCGLLAHNGVGSELVPKFSRLRDACPDKLFVLISIRHMDFLYNRISKKYTNPLINLR